MLNEYSPAVPYERVIPGGVAPRYRLSICGYVPKKSKMFDINLKCGEQRVGFPEPDFALHFNPRFEDSVVVRNTLSSNIWGVEERDGGFPFKRGAVFQVDIYAEDHFFRVNVNGNFFTQYHYRTALNEIKVLSIGGSVSIYQIMSTIFCPSQFEETQLQPFYPSNCFGIPMFINYPRLPINILVPGFLQPEMMFSFVGRVKLGAHRFHINWETANGDVAFHFNPRISEGQTVRNSCISGNWGSEDRDAAYFPFTPGMVFSLMVKCYPEHFEVLVEGKTFAKFQHRLQPLNKVNSIALSGDVEIYSIAIAI